MNTNIKSKSVVIDRDWVEDFEPGDVVALRCGGVLYTVIDVGRFTGLVFMENQDEQANYPPHMLVHQKGVESVKGTRATT